MLAWWHERRRVVEVDATSIAKTATISGRFGCVFADNTHS